VNDSDADGDGDLGIQLTDDQRDELANSIANNDGREPYDLGDTGLISPLSEPNEGEETRLKIRHDWAISENTMLTQQVQYRQYDSDFIRQTGAFNYIYWDRRDEINADPRAPLVIDGVLYPFAARRQEYRWQVSSEEGLQYFADLKSAWRGERLRGEHLLSLNVEEREMSVKSWSAYDADGSTGDNPLPYILDINNPNWPTGKFTDYDHTLRSNYDKGVSAYGIGLQEILYLTDALTARLGLSHSTISQDYQHKGTDRSPEVTPEADTKDNGYGYNVGLNYRFTPHVASFMNVAQGRTAYSILGSVTGEDDRPDSESQSLDVGIRVTGFNGRLMGSLVAFETSRTNLRRSNPLYNDNEEDPEFNIDVPKYFYDDEDRTRGGELDLNVALLQHWSVNLNYTYQDAETIRSDENLGLSKGAARNFASLWTHYSLETAKLPNPLQFSLGTRYVSKRSIESTAFGIPSAYLPSYTVWDAGIAYDTENWGLQLNIENLFDETYYQKAMFLGGLPGEARHATLTFRYSF